MNHRKMQTVEKELKQQRTTLYQIKQSPKNTAGVRGRTERPITAQNNKVGGKSCDFVSSCFRDETKT